MKDEAAILRPPTALTEADLTPKFRVVARAGVRRGIRLENLFWETLKALASGKKSSLAALVDQLADSVSGSANLSSAIRVTCLRWLMDENARLAELTSMRTVKAILAASPSPAFALASSKTITAFNPPFQQLVRRQLTLGAGPVPDGKQDLKLALDINVTEIFKRLGEAGEMPVTTGFVLGSVERRYRGQLNIVRAPVREPELLLAYVSQ